MRGQCYRNPVEITPGPVEITPGLMSGVAWWFAGMVVLFVHKLLRKSRGGCSGPRRDHSGFSNSISPVEGAPGPVEITPGSDLCSKSR